MQLRTIIFMGRIFEVPWGGVREVAESLLRAAAPIAEEQQIGIQVLVPRAGLCPVSAGGVSEVVLPRFGGNRILWDHVTVRKYANSQQGAVLYNPKLVLPEFLRIPGFTSIHDLMYFRQPEKYDWREYKLGDTLYMQLMVRRTVRRSPLTHVDSHHTRGDAIQLFPNVPPESFRVIHLGVDGTRFGMGSAADASDADSAALSRLGLRKPYFLHTGGLSRRKNVSLLVDAFNEFQASHDEFQLVITGGSKPTVPDPSLPEAMSRAAPGLILRLGTVSDSDLACLYRNAHAYVFPSLYEGFGLPVLEAQSSGCPVICSTASSLPEVARDSALMFDPGSKAALLACMNATMEPEVREGIIARGLANAAHFTWEKTARAWISLAQEVYSLGTQGKRGVPA